MANLQYFILFCSQELKKMFIKQNKKYVKIVLPLACIVALMISWCSFTRSIPDEIHMIQGKETVFEGNLPIQADIIEENINKAFKPMKMIAEKIPTVAICGMGKSINNLAKEIIKDEEEYIKMEQMKVLGLNEEILNCRSALTLLEELNKMFSEIDTESISNLKKRIKYCKNPMDANFGKTEQPFRSSGVRVSVQTA